MEILCIDDREQIPTFVPLAQRFLCSLEYSPETIRTYRTAIMSFLDWMASAQVKKPVREDVVRWKETVRQTCSLGTAQTYLTAVKLFFRYLQREKRYPDITDSIRGMRTGHFPKRDYLTVGQMLSVLERSAETANGIRNYAIILLMATCGLRVSEIVRANIGDLRMVGSHLLLSIHGKGRDGKTEFVSVPKVTSFALSCYLKTRKETTGGSPLFVAQSNRCYGQRLSTRSISGLVKETFVRCGLDSRRLTAHSLRHTAITLALQVGCSLQEAQQFARHSLITTTQIYAHNLEHIRNPCSEQVAKTLFPPAAFPQHSGKNSLIETSTT